jgi:hypothetical protein
MLYWYISLDCYQQWYWKTIQWQLFVWGLFGFHLYCNELPSDPCRNFLWWFVYGLYSVQSTHGSLIGLMIVVMFSFGWFFILCETTNKVQCLGLLYFFVLILPWFTQVLCMLLPSLITLWHILNLNEDSPSLSFFHNPFFFCFYGCEVLFYEWCSIENNELLILVEGLEDFELFTFFFALCIFCHGYIWSTKLVILAWEDPFFKLHFVVFVFLLAYFQVLLFLTSFIFENMEDDDIL